MEREREERWWNESRITNFNESRRRRFFILVSFFYLSPAKEKERWEGWRHGKKVTRPKSITRETSIERLIRAREKSRACFLTFQADFLAAKVEQRRVVPRIGRSHVQLQQNLDFGAPMTGAEKSHTETRGNLFYYTLR